ncbi:hypothetical protein GWK48_03385 [Metallosphaera tengchongensis]|uniref:THUMP domain-containing protein n=1 Tax=Metallosphaera tengchongensis TaxID=1532350 RepID=A0A6N0NUK5_9CREN|nr:THUMP domain-containing protein [Metallosphaera tengchongensis]QKQ99562.1 hypothetical protein GWK48_03385 [Metallosphaera tengchongensis]
MSSKNLCLLITTAPNKGRKCRIEVLNRILPHDSEASVDEVVANVLLVNSKLPSQLCYGLVISAPPACARKVYPIVLFSPSTYQDVLETSKLLLDRLRGTSYVECFVRGGSLDCRVLQMAIGGLLKDTKIDSKNYSIKLTLNVLKDVTTFSLLSKGQEKVSVKSPGQNIR